MYIYIYIQTHTYIYTHKCKQNTHFEDVFRRAFHQVFTKDGENNDQFVSCSVLPTKRLHVCNINEINCGEADGAVCVEILAL